MMYHKICFYGEKLPIPLLSLLPILIWSTVENTEKKIHASNTRALWNAVSCLSEHIWSIATPEILIEVYTVENNKSYVLLLLNTGKKTEMSISGSYLTL